MALRLGLVSTANINGNLLGGARATEEVQVVAVASRDSDRAAAYAAEHGIERAHGSYDDLLADPEIDAVYVPLPNSLHVEWSIRALRGGQARAVREAADPPAAGGGGRVRRRRARGARPHGGVHVAPFAADRPAAGAARRGRGR